MYVSVNRNQPFFIVSTVETRREEKGCSKNSNSFEPARSAGTEIAFKVADAACPPRAVSLLKEPNDCILGVYTEVGICIVLFTVVRTLLMKNSKGSCVVTRIPLALIRSNAALFNYCYVINAWVIHDIMQLRPSLRHLGSHTRYSCCLGPIW